jgi:hypothetical protein
MAIAEALIAGGTLLTRMAWKGALLVNGKNTARKIAGMKKSGRWVTNAITAGKIPRKLLAAQTKK